MITCALVNSNGNSPTVAGTRGSMVGHSSASDSPGQVHRTAAGDQADESTSSAAEESSPSSPSIQNCQQQRSAPCRLFIASSDQSQEPRCVICGFYELDHLVRVRPPTAATPAPVTNGNGHKHSSTQRHPSNEQSLTNGIPPRHCDSDWNIFDHGAPKRERENFRAQSAWRNSYDVRGEYLTKEDFRAKYGNYFNPSSSSSFDSDRPSGANEDGNNRKFYYQPSKVSNVYYYTDRGRINDSGGDTDIEQKPQKNRPVPTYWSDSEAVKQPNIVATDPFPLITFRPSAPTKSGHHRHSTSLAISLANPSASSLTEDVSQKKPASTMFGQRSQEQPDIPPRRSAFVDYKAPCNGQNGASEIPKQKRKKKAVSTGVSFYPQTAIIGHDGGAEHFFRSESSDGSSTLDEENGHDGASDDDEVIWTMDSKSDFEKLTDINTEFNADRSNFVADEANGKSDAAVLVSVTVRPPQATPFSRNGDGYVKTDGPQIAPDLAGHAKRPYVAPTAQENSPVYTPIRKPASAIAKSSPSEINGRESELEQKLHQMARDLKAGRIGAPRVKAPAPPPPTVPPPSAPVHARVGGVKKSYSAFVVPTPSPVLNASSTNLMTASANGSRRNGGGSGQEVLDRAISHDRCSSVDASSPPTSDASHSALGKAIGSRQSRSRFASIRKFLRMSEPNSSAIVGSVRRSHHDSSSTNCSTISCSSSSNGSISFGHHGGFHASLRKFPLLPFVMNGTKSRSDLNTVRGLFHGANECRAVDEIAQDTDVVVTEINELPSTNNTLVRASKRICAYGLPSPQTSGDEERNEKKGKPTNGFEHSCLDGTTNRVKHDEEAALDCSPVYINRLEINGHEAQILAAPSSPVTQQSAASLPPRPPPSTAGASASHAKVKRTAPGVPTSSGESAPPEKVTANSTTEAEPRTLPECSEKSTEAAVWHLATTVAVQTTPAPNPQPSTSGPMPVSSSASRAPTPASTDSIKRSTSDDRYDQLVAGHLTALSHLIEHFPSTTRQCRRKLINLGVDSTKLKWSDFNVVANTPLLVTETSALYAGVLRLENKSESQSLKVDLMITPLRYNNPLPTPSNQYRSYFPPVVAEFQEYVPSKLIKLSEEDEDSDGSDSEATPTGPDGKADKQHSTLCKVLVLPRMMVSNMESYADHTSSRHRPQKQPCLHEKEVCFIMIQLVSALKYLQSKGIEEIQADLDGFLLYRTVSSRYPQLVLCCESFSSDYATRTSRSGDKTDHEEKTVSNRRLRITLCQGALAALCQLLHTEVPTEELIRERHVPVFTRLTSFSDGFQKAADVLQAEKPHSLTQAKSLFEYMFWVGSEHQNGSEKPFDSEQQARWWLDRERAKFVCHAMKALLYFPVDGVSENGNAQSTVSASVSKLDIVDEYRAQFLLHATAKSLVDAAMTLDNGHMGEIML